MLILWLCLWLCCVVVTRSASVTLPDFVLRHAPLIHWHTQEICWPSSLEVHLEYVSEARRNRTLVADAPSPITLDNLNHPSLDDKDVFLTSTDDPTVLPEWFRSETGKPDSEGWSSAPAVLVVVDKSQIEPGLLDAYWFVWTRSVEERKAATLTRTSGQIGPYVAALDQKSVLELPLVSCLIIASIGSHVSDWEHLVVRFLHGEPQSVFLSQHGKGSSYTFDAIYKDGDRPVAFAALGTHALRAVSGRHRIYAEHVADFCDYGPRWDPRLNYQAYTYAEPEGKPRFDAAKGTTWPTAWLYSHVRWGDQRLEATDPRQKTVGGFVKWTDGSTGPIDKNLMSRAIEPHRPDAEPAAKLPEVVPGEPPRVLGPTGTEAASASSGVVARLSATSATASAASSSPSVDPLPPVPPPRSEL